MNPIILQRRDGTPSLIRSEIHWLLVLVTGLAFLAATAVRAEETPSQRGLRFSHKFHVEEQSIECANCHAKAAKSATGLDDLLPGHNQCAECHDVQAANDCGMCHTSGAPALSPRVTNYSPRFSHQRHLDDAKLQCTACHSNLDVPVAAEKAGHFPVMAECMSCHEQRNATLECTVCHTPDEPRTPKDHLANWRQSHGAAASAMSDNNCNQCHGRSNVVDCQSCHNGDQVFYPHPRNYLSRHGQDAHLSDLRCMTCHDTQDDCNACHRQMNVLPAEHFRPGWVNRTEGGEHSTQAQYDLASCMSCHDTPSQEPTCVRCHGK